MSEKGEQAFEYLWVQNLIQKQQQNLITPQLVSKLNPQLQALVTQSQQQILQRGLYQQPQLPAQLPPTNQKSDYTSTPLPQPPSTSNPLQLSALGKPQLSLEELQLQQQELTLLSQELSQLSPVPKPLQPEQQLPTLPLQITSTSQKSDYLAPLQQNFPPTISQPIHPQQTRKLPAIPQRRSVEEDHQVEFT